MNGIFEETLKFNKELIAQVTELISKIDQLQVKDTSWVDVPFIQKDMNISNKEFHEYWKKKMTFLRRAKGSGSKYKAIRHEYEAWKEGYWQELSN